MSRTETFPTGVRSFGRIATAAVVGALVIGAAAGTAEAKKRKRIDPRLYRNPLVLTSFLQEGRLDVHRNEPLTFRFSAMLQKSSVDNRSIRVTEVTGGGLRPAVGALVTKQNTIRFDPTRTQLNYNESRKKNTTVTDKDNPVGFAAYMDFAVTIPGPPEFHVLRNSQGAGILQGYVADFRTDGTYDDPVAGQPIFVGEAGSGQLGFDPPRSGATGLVDEDAIIILEFNEPILIDTLDPSTTVLVRRVTVNEYVPGFIRLDPGDRSGRRFQFVPSLGFGSDEANLSGWDIEVQLTQGITDLAGNPLKRPVTAPLFRTRYVPGKPSSSIVNESFVDQVKMDASTPTLGGEWNTLEKGALRGGAASTYTPVEVIYTSAVVGSPSVVRTRVNDPLVTSQSQAGCIARPAGSRAQMLYVPGDVGVDAAITSVGWGPSSNALFGSAYDSVDLRLGHSSLNSLSNDFNGNYLGNPVKVYEGQYIVPQAKNIKTTDPQNANGVSPDPTATGFWLWPTFTAPFEWNGTNNLIFDAAVKSGNNCQILRIAFIPAGIAFPNRRAVATNYQAATADVAPDTVVYDIQFRKRRRTTRAISKFYELASDSPVFAAPVISPVGQSGGVQVIVEMEGAHGTADPLNPGGFIPNPTTATGWTTDVTEVDGHRFFRFRFTMIANLSSGQTARITSAQFPYQF